MIEGFCWPLSAAPGETISFRVRTSAQKYTVSYASFRTRAGATATDVHAGDEITADILGDIAPFDVNGHMYPDHAPDEDCTDWGEGAAVAPAFQLTVPAWRSGIFAALCNSGGSACCIPFVVKPGASRAKLLVLANVNTWNAYNGWGGYSRYRQETGWPGPHRLSFLRPNPQAIGLKLNSGGDYEYNSKHLCRGELWFLNWLRDAGYAFDVYSDLDFHSGIAALNDYKGIILHTHPEYWSTTMFDTLEAYANTGGNLLYLGGNGLYDSVEIDPDLTGITVFGGYGSGRERLLRFTLGAGGVARQERKLLGVAFEWNGNDAGNRADQRNPYRVTAEGRGHRFLIGGAFDPAGRFGHRGLAVMELDTDKARGLDLTDGGASGWEVDNVDDSDPLQPEVQTLARGENPSGGADLVYFDRVPGGGFTLSAGSMSVQGSIPIDTVLQMMIRRALDEVILGLLPPAAPLTALARNSDFMDVFVVRTARGVIGTWWNGNPWRPWFLLDKDPPFASLTPIAAVSRNDNQMDLFAVDQGQIFSNWFTGGWNQWFPLPSGPRFPARAPIVALSRDPDFMDVVCVDVNGDVQLSWWNGNPWRPWTPIPGRRFPTGTRLAGLCRHSDHMEIFAIDAERLWNAFFDGAWHPWQATLPASHTSFPPNTPIAAISRNPNQMDLFAIGWDGQVHSCWWNGSWNDWFPLPLPSGAFPQHGFIAAMARTANFMDIVAVDQNGDVRLNWWNGNPWRGWTTLYGKRFAPGAPIAAIARDTNNMDIFIVDDDGHLWSNWFEGFWRGWFRVK